MSVTLLKPLPVPQDGRTVARMYPMWGPGAPVLCYANNGLVRLVDERPGTPADRRIRTLSIKTFKARLEAFTSMIVTHAEDPRWGFERQRAQQFLQAAYEVVNEAKVQGSPFAKIKKAIGYDRFKQLSAFGQHMQQMETEHKLQGGVVLPSAATSF